MSREIKFRAWHKADEKMYEVYGFTKSQWFLRGKNFPMPPGAVEILQRTGLKDKNGKEIYEGDIVTGINRLHEFKSEQNVHFLNGCFMFGNWNAHEFFNKHQFIEVIGNIYENPELLEDSHE